MTREVDSIRPGAPAFPPTSRLAARRAFALVLAIAAVALAIVLARRPPIPTSRPEAGDLVLDETFDLAKGPADRRVLSPGPGVFRVAVPSATVPVRVTLGPPLPSTREAEGGPDPSQASVVQARPPGGSTGALATAPSDVAFYSSGILVVRVEAASTASAGATARVTIRRAREP